MGTRTARRLALTPGWASGRLSLTARQRPILDWRFAEDRSLVDRVRGLPLTFTRASGSSIITASGTISTLANDAPLFDSNGLQIWDARTNTNIYSQDFTGTGWSRTNITAAISGTAPDGTNTANVMTASGGSIGFLVNTPSVTSGTTYTFSGFYKAGSLTTVQFLALGTSWNSGGSNPTLTINLSTGVVTPSNMPSSSFWSIQSLADGWYRLAVTLTATATGASHQQYVRMTALSGTVLAWGMQMETGTGASPYIATTNASVTRAAESTETLDVSWLDSLGGLLYFEGINVARASGVIQAAISLEDGTANNRMQLRTVTQQVTGVVVSGGSVTFNQPAPSGSWPNGQVARGTMRLRAADPVVATGGQISTIGSATIPTVNRLRIGWGSSVVRFNGTLSRIAYFGSGAALSRYAELSI